MATSNHATKNRVIRDEASVPLMLKLQIAKAGRELHKLRRSPATNMTQVWLLNSHIDEATVAFDLGRYRDAKHCLQIFWKATREDLK